MAKDPSQPIVVLMTASSGDEANGIAEMLISKRLAGCVQILPEMQSIYFWKGEVQRDREVPILAKTVASKFSDLEREVRALHSYETPEIVALPIIAGSTPYLEWLAENLQSEQQRSTNANSREAKRWHRP